ncbi:MAG: 4-hydroxy-tetrahydrodipicolinate reductase [Elusimicrobia bacterium RIFCSPLOWO2_01_FULL_64_13]|nr:MAG: 4-hydroxy-tetrahydrodipicolinate reductase [Elusimicrobia bacterium RIFCSPHIGHO2_01_FULL_64_10]OGR97622.1 MAG: 4-hydroxy-tetrahydrodipicolinate reductase [Elusimicrobia bacterium RIFCSPLOWO2_01_FULL_64_13]
MIRIAVSGALGRMGERILALAAGDVRLRIAGALESPGHPGLGRKMLDGRVTVASDLSALKGLADVLIDFSSPHATLERLETLSRWRGAAAVVGTTGLSPAQSARLKRLAHKTAIVFSPNMSRGVNVLLELVRSAARGLPGYDVEIVETHHSQKKDAPSGTALALAGEIASELGRNPRKDFIYGRKGRPGERTPDEIGIHAVRAGDNPGEHTVIFASRGEKLELTHRAGSRDAFAAGALAAALWVAGRAPGLYSMRDVLRSKR